MEMSRVLTVELALLLQVAAQGAALAHVWAEKTSLKKKSWTCSCFAHTAPGLLAIASVGEATEVKKLGEGPVSGVEI